MTTTIEKRREQQRDARARRAYRRVQSLQEACYNLWANAKRFGWSHDDILKYRAEHIYGTDAWRKCTQAERAEVMGYYDALYQVYTRQHITHSYLCQDGERRIQGEYTYPSSNRKDTLIPDTCELVWIESRKIF